MSFAKILFTVVTVIVSSTVLLTISVASASVGGIVVNNRTEADRNGAIEKPYFFEVKINGSSSYILGTFHVGVSLNELPQIVTERLQEAGSLWVEKILSRQLVSGTLENSLDFFVHIKNQQNRRQGLDKSPLTLSEKQTLRTFFHLPDKIINVMRCNDLINYFFMNGDYTFPKIKSLEYSILNDAYLRQLPIHELDSDELRMRALEASIDYLHRKSMNEADLIEAPPTGCNLKDQLQNPRIFEQAEENEVLLTKYRRHTLQPDNDPFVTYRNSAWLHNRSFLQNLANGGTFVAVGAMHLLGKKGLLEGLKAKGFQIRQLP